MQKHYHLLFTSDGGPVWRLSCGHRRLTWIGAATVGCFILLMSLSLRSAALSVQAVNLRTQVAALEQQMVAKDAELLAQQRLDQEDKERLGAKVAALTTEKDTVMKGAVRELSSRSALIDKMLGKIGLHPGDVDMGDASATTEKKAQANAQVNAQANSGGPFIALKPQTVDLLNQADRYLATLSKLPLGAPANGSLASPFGTRIDPLNWRRAFHAGMDFKGERGDKVFATADGVVKEAEWNGSFGRYVEIDHGNGYSTAYAHLSKFTVQAGNPVQRGQLIGYIGSSGRSTGPHLHYELRYHGIAIDPGKYVRIAAINGANK
ncbi:MAG: M23 family metallopeptidase [Desulfobulbaceae bacterium]|jgi:murein DD-endopeptidase MepM/ murein hydrolase activator NlpD|nr:M23 family metallopeptidase [Desulfobulbaceae bacterium]